MDLYLEKGQFCPELEPWSRYLREGVDISGLISVSENFQSSKSYPLKENLSCLTSQPQPRELIICLQTKNNGGGCPVVGYVLQTSSKNSKINITQRFTRALSTSPLLAIDSDYTRVKLEDFQCGFYLYSITYAQDLNEEEPLYPVLSYSVSVTDKVRMCWFIDPERVNIQRYRIHEPDHHIAFDPRRNAIETGSPLYTWKRQPLISIENGGLEFIEKI
jgi:hypothetical protein